MKCLYKGLRRKLSRRWLNLNVYLVPWSNWVYGPVAMTLYCQCRLTESDVAVQLLDGKTCRLASKMATEGYIVENVFCNTGETNFRRLPMALPLYRWLATVKGCISPGRSILHTIAVVKWAFERPSRFLLYRVRYFFHVSKAHEELRNRNYAER